MKSQKEPKKRQGDWLGLRQPKKRSFKQRSKVELARVLERMKARLRDPRDKRKEICIEAGMNQHAAAKFFKTRTGLTMGEYRTQHQDLERIAGIDSRQ